MNQSTLLAILHAAAWLCMICSASGQSFKLDSIHYDSFGGLIQLGWESQPGRVYSLHSSTNLTNWEELSSGVEPLRILATSGSRTQAELAVPAGNRRFWRVGRRSIFNVGTLISEGAGYSGPTLTDVNDDSRVVGYFMDGNNSQIGFTWAPGEELHSFGPQSYASAVNSAGTVVGTRYGNGNFFSWTKNGGLVELGDGRAVDVNSAGHIVGQDDSGAFLWKPGTGKIRIPPLLPNEPFNGPNAISDAGHVVGASRDSDSTRAFLWTESGGLVDLNAGWGSSATHVNSSGKVVGYRWLVGIGPRAFSWSASGDLVTFPEGCAITDLSENGKVVGYGYRAAVDVPEQVFSWTQAGGIVALGNGYPKHVNELGQIVGSKSTSTGVSAALWSSSGGQTELEGLASQKNVASLINNNGVIFGYSLPSGGVASHLVMWTTNPAP